MTTYPIPRKPYDEVASEFIRREISRGSFDDLEYRRYVNELVWIEWYTLIGPSSAGISAYGCSLHNWRVAATFPNAYDEVRRDHDAPTRSEQEWRWNGEEDPQDRREWAGRHRSEWEAVQKGEQRPPETRNQLGRFSSRRFAPFRFPIVPYDTVQSSFIREEIRQGTFDDLEYRRYVNKLTWIEWNTTDWDGGPTYGSIMRNCRLAAEYPQEYDLLRLENGAETRASFDTPGEVSYGNIDIEETAHEYKRSWQTVQEAVDDEIPDERACETSAWRGPPRASNRRP